MKVAVVGATGIVGETVLRVLEERRLPVSSLAAFASRDRAAAVMFRGRSVDVHRATADSLRGFDVVFFAGGDQASVGLAAGIAGNGCIVIDNSATFRLDPNVALIVPEINAAALRPQQRIFPVANCTAIIVCVALAPVCSVAGLQRVHAATYQAVSGAGRPGLDELQAAEHAIQHDGAEPPPQAFAARIARNVVPQIGELDQRGYTLEETKIQAEVRKILALDALPFSVIAVRVPVRYAHCAAVFFETERAASVKDLSAALEEAPGLVYHGRGIVTPRDVEGTDDVHVARLRAEDESGHRFAMWICGDQVRKGAATNGVQILELLLERGMVAA